MRVRQGNILKASWILHFDWFHNRPLVMEEWHLVLHPTEPILLALRLPKITSAQAKDCILFWTETSVPFTDLFIYYMIIHANGFNERLHFNWMCTSCNSRTTKSPDCNIRSAINTVLHKPTFQWVLPRSTVGTHTITVCSIRHCMIFKFLLAGQGLWSQV